MQKALRLGRSAFVCAIFALGRDGLGLLDREIPSEERPHGGLGESAGETESAEIRLRDRQLGADHDAHRLAVLTDGLPLDRAVEGIEHVARGDRVLETREVALRDEITVHSTSPFR